MTSPKLVAIDHYHSELRKHSLEENALKVKQFGIIPIDFLEAEAVNNLGVSRETLIAHGAWALNKPDGYAPDLNIALLAMKAGPPHLAYLQTLKLVLLLAKSFKGKCYASLGTFDHVIALKSQSEIRSLVSQARPILVSNLAGLDVIWIVEESCFDWHWWTMQVARLISVNKTAQLLGKHAGGTVLQEWLIPSMITAFLAPQFIDGKPKPTVVACGNSEIPFLAIARQVAPKLGFLPPLGIYLSTVPNTLGTGRMASKNEKTALFLGENPMAAETKLQKAATGGRSQEQHAIYGGEYTKCTFLRLVSLVQTAADTSQMIAHCMSGMTCSKCKEEAIPRAVRGICGKTSSY